MERTAVSLFVDGKSAELTKFMKSVKNDEVMITSCSMSAFSFCLNVKPFTVQCFENSVNA